MAHSTKLELREEVNRLRSEAQSRELLESQADGVSVLINGKIVFANASLVELLGDTREKIIGKQPTDFLIPEDHQRAKQNIKQRIEGSPHFANEYTVLRKDNTTIPVEVLATRITYSGEPALLSVIRDITKRKVSEQNLRTSEANFRKMAEEIPVGISIFQDGRPVFVNQWVKEVTGYAIDELMNMKPGQLMEPGFQKRFAQMLDECLAQGVTLRDEFCGKNKAGQKWWIDYSISRIEYNGRPALLGASIDITERKRAEEENQQLQENLTHVTRLSTMGEMATGLAHELNQPLAAITTYCYAGELALARVEPASPERLRMMFEKMKKQAMRAGEIIRRLRALVRKRPAIRDHVDIVEMIQEVFRLMESDLSQSKVYIELQENHSSPLAFMDETQIQQVLVNLIRNALDAMNEIPPEMRSLKITISKPSDDLLEVAICDTGKGVSLDEQDHVFDAFYSSKPEGMGMGLAISRTIIESHGGSLWMSPNADQGATFFFTLSTLKEEIGYDIRSSVPVGPDETTRLV